MRQPGEVHPEKGRDRSMLFAACLQQIVPGFRAQFYSNTHPDKMKIDVTRGRSFSFDIVGRLSHIGADCEVWIEAKGYDTSTKLLGHYREFVVNVALARLYHARVQADLFWFVASTPFACDLGAQVSTPQWVQECLTLRASANDGVIQQDELPLVAERGFEDLANHIRVLLLTPQLMKTTGLRQYVRPNENLWTLTEKLYGGLPSMVYFQTYAQQVAARNNLLNPDLLQIGQALELPYLGPSDDSEL
jgi:hypothetical protein